MLERSVCAQRIKDTRKSKKLSRQALAEKAEISAMSIRRYENGEREPRSSEIKSIARALEVAPGYLVGITVDPEGKILTKENADALDKFTNDHLVQMGILLKMLNTEGKDVAIDCVAGLAFIPKYQADPDVFPLKDDTYIRKKED